MFDESSQTDMKVLRSSQWTGGNGSGFSDNCTGSEECLVLEEVDGVGISKRYDECSEAVLMNRSKGQQVL